jgi:hypothetical protein
MSNVPVPMGTGAVEVGWVEGLLAEGDANCQHVNTIAAQRKQIAKGSRAYPLERVAATRLGVGMGLIENNLVHTRNGNSTMSIWCCQITHFDLLQ